MSKEVYIVDGVRTPIGNFGGTLSTVRPDDLAALVIKTLVERNPKINPSEIEEVVFGCANQAGEDNRNVARMASLLAGLPTEVSAETVNILCASGMAATIKEAASSNDSTSAGRVFVLKCGKLPPNAWRAALKTPIG